MDKILDFDVSSRIRFWWTKRFGLGSKIKFKSVKGKNKLNLAKSKFDFVYESKTGFLYFNENGKKSGWGDGGLFAHLQNKVNLFGSDFDIV